MNKILLVLGPVGLVLALFFFLNRKKVREQEELLSKLNCELVQLVERTRKIAEEMEPLL
jgi:hypothetical protein